LNLAVEHSTFNASANQSTLIWAIICSILIHGLLVTVLPNIHFDSAKTPDLLEIQFVEKKPEPPAVQPEPIKPEATPIKPKVQPKLEPIVKPLPALTKSEPEPTQPQQNATPAATKIQPEVIAVAPKVDITPTVITVPEPVSEPPKPTGPSQADIDEARGRYGNTLWNAIEKHKNYPRIAQIRGWQGDVIVELLLDGNGRLKLKKVIQSSGYEALDKQALEMAEQASPFPAPPEALRGNNFSIKVPIPFKLESQ
jgi:periplasmic protein TonB